LDLAVSLNYRASVVIAALMIWLPSRIVIRSLTSGLWLRTRIERELS
jgi:hypothetical protein